jgi:hypothetical protein
MLVQSWGYEGESGTGGVVCWLDKWWREGGGCDGLFDRRVL